MRIGIGTGQARILISKLPEHVGQRELAVVRDELKWRADECVIGAVQYPIGSGNAVVLATEAQHVTEVCTGFGERGTGWETLSCRISSCSFLKETASFQKDWS